MHPRAVELIATLELKPHPEGGFYRELFRSSSHVKPQDDRPSRAALTTIYFLLTADAVSRWHRVGSDEVWHGPYALMGCTVGPGFDFADFHLMADDPRAAQVVRTEWPELVAWI